MGELVPEGTLTHDISSILIKIASSFENILLLY